MITMKAYADPYDDKFIACAISASADFIVSGDKDLLETGEYKSVKTSISRHSRQYD